MTLGFATFWGRTRRFRVVGSHRGQARPGLSLKALGLPAFQSIAHVGLEHILYLLGALPRMPLSLHPQAFMWPPACPLCDPPTIPIPDSKPTPRRIQLGFLSEWKNGT